MIISLAQIDCCESNIANQLNKVKEFIVAAQEKGTKLLVFPELVDLGYYLSCYSEVTKTPWYSVASELNSLTSSSQITLLIGGCLFEHNSIYNTLFIVRPNEAVVPAYRKISLFGNEKEYFTSGLSATIVTISNLTFGLHICFDLRFPELFYYKNKTQPQVQIISAAWPLSRIVHWKALLIARAIENQCFIVAVNRVGNDNGIVFGGSSCIISPLGEILSESNSKDEVLLSAEIEPSLVMEIRKSFPLFENRKSISEM